MAITYGTTPTVTSVGARFRSVSTISLDNSYPTGGYTLDPTKFGLTSFEQVNATANGSTYIFNWLPSTTKLQVLTVGGGGGSPTFTGDPLSGHAHNPITAIKEAVAVAADTGTLSAIPNIVQFVYVTAGGVTGPFTIIPDDGTLATGLVRVSNNTSANISFFAADAVTAAEVTFTQGTTTSVSAGTPAGTITGGGTASLAEVASLTNLIAVTNVQIVAFGQ